MGFSVFKEILFPGVNFIWEANKKGSDILESVTNIISVKARNSTQDLNKIRD